MSFNKINNKQEVSKKIITTAIYKQKLSIILPYAHSTIIATPSGAVVYLDSMLCEPQEAARVLLSGSVALASFTRLNFKLY